MAYEYRDVLISAVYILNPDISKPTEKLYKMMRESYIGRQRFSSLMKMVTDHCQDDIDNFVEQYKTFKGFENAVNADRVRQELSS